jgi:hypothetical protein
MRLAAFLLARHCALKVLHCSVLPAGLMQGDTQIMQRVRLVWDELQNLLIAGRRFSKTIFLVMG